MQFWNETSQQPIVLCFDLSLFADQMEKELSRQLLKSLWSIVPRSINQLHMRCYFVACEEGKQVQHKPRC